MISENRFRKLTARLKINRITVKDVCVCVCVFDIVSILSQFHIIEPSCDVDYCLMTGL